MISDVLFDAIIQIRQYLYQYPDVYSASVRDIERLVAEMDHLRQSLDRLPTPETTEEKYMKQVLTYTPDAHPDKFYACASQALHDDILDAAQQIAVNLTGFAKCDANTVIEKGLLRLLDQQISPRRLTRKYAQLWRILKAYQAAVDSEQQHAQKTSQSPKEEIPF